LTYLPEIWFSLYLDGTKYGEIMKRLHYIVLKNSLALGNLLANVLGIFVVEIISNYSVSPSSMALNKISEQIDKIYLPITFVIIFIFTFIYEGPVRTFLNNKYQGIENGKTLSLKAGQRVLNEPFFIIFLNISIWLLAAVVYPMILYYHDAPNNVVIRVFFQTAMVGIIGMTAAFFILEGILRKHLSPIFFPDGGLYQIPKTFHITIKTRLFALIVAANFLPLCAFIAMSMGTFYSQYDPVKLIELFRRAIIFNSLSFILIGTILMFLVSSSLANPFSDIIQALRQIRKGHFDGRITVVSSDEIGYTGDVINEMTQGLKEREFIKDAFGQYVAKEIRDEVLAGRVPLDGEQKEVTILFSDLRDFTPLIEQNDPKQMIQMMNMYFKEMDDAIKENNGLIMQFIGDEIYAVFGAPIYTPNHSVNAVNAAISMNEKMTALNTKFKEKGWPVLKHGIGVHSGHALAANIGSPDRKSYLLIGNTVNIASRLQDLNKKFCTELIISEKTVLKIDEEDRVNMPFKALPPTKVKGIAKPVGIYTFAKD